MKAPDDLESILSAVHHSGTTLGSHLLNTWKILQGWSCSEPVCTAGLLHSAYGVLLEPNEASRATLRSKVGADAEEIIFLVHSIPADLVHLAAGAEMPITVPGIDGTDYRVDRALASAIVSIDFASTLEQLLRIDFDPGQLDHRRALFARSLHLLPPAGQDAVARVWQLKGVDETDGTPGLC